VSEQQRIRVAVDLMSGDGGVRTTLAGVLAALRADPELQLDLVGEAASTRAALERMAPAERRRVTPVAAESVLPMDTGAVQALRQGRGSSMHITIDRVADGCAAAAVSAGSTGALMALSRQQLGMLPGIERPALMAALPTLGDAVWVLDLGANVGVNAHRLSECARLGNTAVRVLSGRAPRIGLLNVGKEPGKGPDVVREAARLIEEDGGFDFRGFVEADEVFSGSVDLVVCDGFAGNVLLKSAEGMVELLFNRLRHGMGGLRGWLFRRPLAGLYDKLDPARHNGAPLLGVAGIVMKSHGGACEKGFAAAIGLAALEARRELVSQLEQALWASY